MTVKSPYASTQSAQSFMDSLDFAPSMGSMGHLFVASARATSANALLAPVGQAVALADTKAAGAGSTGNGSGAQSAATSSSPASVDGAAQAIDGVQQKFVVGQGVISFDVGVTADRRKAALHSMLLAQLTANQKYPDPKAIGYAANWMATYLNALQNIGWVIQSDISGDVPENNQNATMEKAILDIATGLIGASGAAAIKVVIQGLESLASDSSPIVLFKQTIEKADVLQFSTSLSSSNATDDFSVKLLQFLVHAKVMNTQVLFFEWDSSHADIAWRNLLVSLDEDIYNAVQSQVLSKILGFGDQINKI